MLYRDKPAFDALKKSILGVLGFSLASFYVAESVKSRNSVLPLETRVVQESPLPVTQESPSLVIQEPSTAPLYSRFPYKNEIDSILVHANRLNIEPEMLMALRMTENGAEGREYGVLPRGDKQKERYLQDKGYQLEGRLVEYKTIGEKQLAWAAKTVVNNQERFRNNPEGHQDFISYLASVYAPIGASNDPSGLNRNWEKNFRAFYRQLKENK